MNERDGYLALALLFFLGAFLIGALVFASAYCHDADKDRFLDSIRSKRR